MAHVIFRYPVLASCERVLCRCFCATHAFSQRCYEFLYSSMGTNVQFADFPSVFNMFVGYMFSSDFIGSQ